VVIKTISNSKRIKEKVYFHASILAGAVKEVMLIKKTVQNKQRYCERRWYERIGEEIAVSVKI